MTQQEIDNCPICGFVLETLRKDHELSSVIFICFNCGTTFEKENGELIKSKRFEVT